VIAREHGSRFHIQGTTKELLLADESGARVFRSIATEWNVMVKYCPLAMGCTGGLNGHGFSYFDNFRTPFVRYLPSWYGPGGASTHPYVSARLCASSALPINFGKHGSDEVCALC
jgi:hypothetical protein